MIPYGVMSAPLYDSSLDKVLVSRPMPKALDGGLEKAWTLLSEQGRIILNLLSKGDPTRASANTGEVLFTYLTDLVIRGAKDIVGISLFGIDESGQVLHAHILFCMSTGNYLEPDLWGILGPLPDDGMPSNVKITPLHLAASHSFLGVSRTELDSTLVGISTEGDNLNNLCQWTAADADGDS